MEVTVKIDTDTPTGRKLMRELAKHPKTVKIENELPTHIQGQKLFTVDEVYNKGLDKLSRLYGTDFRKLKSNKK